MKRTWSSLTLGARPLNGNVVRERGLVKNIQVIDGAQNCVYDIFAATDEEFALIFPPGQDIAFIDEVVDRHPEPLLTQALNHIWTRRIPKVDATGIQGILFYDLDAKKAYYPTHRDEEAVNPDGTRLRASRP